MNQYEDLLVDALLDRGFTVEEALSLIAVQTRIEKMQQEEVDRHQFARWLSHLFHESEPS